MKTAISVINECRAPALTGRSSVYFCFFTKIIFKLTIDISMRKIMAVVTLGLFFTIVKSDLPL